MLIRSLLSASYVATTQLLWVGRAIILPAAARISVLNANSYPFKTGRTIFLVKYGTLNVSEGAVVNCRGGWTGGWSPRILTGAPDDPRTPSSAGGGAAGQFVPLLLHLGHDVLQILLHGLLATRRLHHGSGPYVQKEETVIFPRYSRTTTTTDWAKLTR